MPRPWLCQFPNKNSAGLYRHLFYCCVTKNQMNYLENYCAQFILFIRTEYTTFSLCSLHCFRSLSITQSLWSWQCHCFPAFHPSIIHPQHTYVILWGTRPGTWRLNLLGHDRHSWTGFKVVIGMPYEGRRQWIVLLQWVRVPCCDARCRRPLKISQYLEIKWFNESKWILKNKNVCFCFNICNIIKHFFLEGGGGEVAESVFFLMWNSNMAVTNAHNLVVTYRLTKTF